MRNEKIGRIMSEWPATVSPGDLLSEARELFEAHGIHHLPVVDVETLVGILSTSDFLKLFLLDRSSPSLRRAEVRHVMHRNPVVIHVDATLREAAEKLAVGEFHALPVIDDDARLVGIVTTSDLLEYLLQHVPRGDGSILEDVSELQELAEDNRLLKAACQAAELYIRSGHADREHSVLVKALSDLRESKSVSL
ncbi:MAG: CBS domain-containing protein [Woeseiaceae bacterium]|nr:CBS domain-containing protein [Woeseiaceae bacterium]